MECMPSRIEAMKHLLEAEKMNPGPWVQHSIHVAQSAELIAKRIGSINSEMAYTLGLLHDIGRREGVYKMRHSLDGYKYAMRMGYEGVAKICLSHACFKYRGEAVIVGQWDGSEEEKKFVIEYLNNAKESDYDRLIKLCDCVSLPSGFCLIEKRLIDTSIRGGINELTIPRWKSTFETKAYFEEKLGCSIYDILPNIHETTFG